jgi:hypothetical protein
MKVFFQKWVFASQLLISVRILFLHGKTIRWTSGSRRVDRRRSHSTNHVAVRSNKAPFSNRGILPRILRCV